jgi:hypothetical protein
MWNSTQSGRRVFRFEAGHHSEPKPTTIPRRCRPQGGLHKSPSPGVLPVKRLRQFFPCRGASRRRHTPPAQSERLVNRERKFISEKGQSISGKPCEGGTGAPCFRTPPGLSITPLQRRHPRCGLRKSRSGLSKHVRGEGVGSHGLSFGHHPPPGHRTPRRPLARSMPPLALVRPVVDTTALRITVRSRSTSGF